MSDNVTRKEALLHACKKLKIEEKGDHWEAGGKEKVFHFSKIKSVSSFIFHVSCLMSHVSSIHLNYIFEIRIIATFR